MTSRVLLVEDSQGMRALLQDVFDSFDGFRVVGSAAGEGEAKVWLEDHAGGWDLAVVDLVLADGSGFAVLARATQTHPAGAVVLLSSFLSEGVTRHCFALGAAAVFSKGDSVPFLTWLSEFRDRTAPPGS